MSYGSDMQIWVGDLDGYVNIDAISRANEQEAAEYALEVDLDDLGDITLFSNHTISSRKLYSRGVDPEQWRWMLHRAEKSLGQTDPQKNIEESFLKATMSVTRRYAVTRYASFERLSFSSAITAIFPHGIRALLFSYMAGEQSLSDISCRTDMQRTLHLAASTSNLTAYDQTGLVQRRLHELASRSSCTHAHLKLDKDRMRNILSLSRLYFANRECQVRSAAELHEIELRYESERAAEKQGFDTSQKLTGRKIQNWRLRSLRPLTFYFPFSARHSLKRLATQDVSGAGSIDRQTAANELALIYCEIELMRTNAKTKAKRDG